MLVRAASAANGPVDEKTEVRTNADGIAEMVLTEWVARPGAIARTDPQNAATPHRIAVIDEDGQELAVVEKLAIRGKEAENAEPVVIKLP